MGFDVRNKKTRELFSAKFWGHGEDRALSIFVGGGHYRIVKEDDYEPLDGTFDMYDPGIFVIDKVKEISTYMELNVPRFSPEEFWERVRTEERPPMTEGRKIHLMTDHELANALFKLEKDITNSCFDLSVLWCDGKGGCFVDGEEVEEVNEDMCRACVLRYLRTEIEDPEDSRPMVYEVTENENNN